MTAKIITTYIAAGYTLSSSFSDLYITATGGVGGTGVTAHAASYVHNYGKINGAAVGVTLLGTGAVDNFAGGSITGRVGIESNGAGALVFNYGAIKSTGYKAISLNKGGEIDNGGPFDLTASISGGIYMYGPGSVVDNYGAIKNGPVYISGGGTITNGALGFASATMTGGGVKVTAGAGTVHNYGLIDGNGRTGVALGGGGVVVNGAPTDTTARIEGGGGVAIFGASGAVTNFGTIRGVAASGYGVALTGGAVTNGSVLD